MTKENHSRTTVLILILTFALVSLFQNDVLRFKTRAIKWDGYGYYAYLPALLIYGDADDYDFVSAHFEQYDISSDIYQIRTTKNGKKFPIYNIGLAIIWLPFFTLAHLFCKATSIYPADGMSFPYQLAIVVASIFYLAAAFHYLRKFLLRYYSDLLVSLVLVLIAFGTNYFYYTIDGLELTHTYLFGLYAAFLYFLDRYYNSDKFRHLLIASILAGLLVLIRSSEIVVLFLPFLHGLVRNNFREKLWKNVKVCSFMLAVVLLVFSMQLLYYKSTTGYWFLNGYEGHHFDLLNPHFYEGFIGFRRGFFIYTPMMFFAVIGIFLLYRYSRAWAWSVLGFFLFNSYIVYSWHIWWYGSTFGSRPVVQSYAVLALPLAAFLFFVSKQKLWLKVLFSFLFTFLVFLNIFQTWQYKKGIIPMDFVNKTYYRQVFLKTRKDVRDYIYLDINEKFPDDQTYRSKAYFSLDTVLSISGKNSSTYQEYKNLFDEVLSTDEAQDLSKQWMRASMVYSYRGDSFDKWTAPKLVTDISSGKDVVKWTALRLPVVMRNKALDSIAFEQQLPLLTEGDRWKMFFWNTSADSLTIYRCEISILSPERE